MHELPDPFGARRLEQLARGVDVHLAVAAVGNPGFTKRGREVIHVLPPADGARDHLAVGDVAVDHIHLARQTRACARPVSRDDAHVVPLLHQGRHEMRARESGTAGDEHARAAHATVPARRSSASTLPYADSSLRANMRGE